MFKSKGFTIGFIILAALNVFLIVVLILLSTGRGDSAMDKIIRTTTTAEEPVSPTGIIDDVTSPVETEPPFTARVLTVNDPHSLPVVGELIKEQGSFTINESAAVGVVFHKLPVFDSAEAEGNTVNYRGTFQVDGKIFVTDSDGKPYLMYHTAEGYYVTGNSNYVKYKAAAGTVPEAPEKVTDYVSQDGRSQLTVHLEDGSHLLFSLTRNGETLLENAVAVYDQYGSARFEYLTEMGASTGDLTFSYEGGTLSVLTVLFAKEIPVDGDKFSTLTLTVKN